jgi:hypothetical protein
VHHSPCSTPRLAPCRCPPSTVSAVTRPHDCCGRINSAASQARPRRGHHGGQTAASRHCSVLTTIAASAYPLLLSRLVALHEPSRRLATGIPAGHHSPARASPSPASPPSRAGIISPRTALLRL